MKKKIGIGVLVVVLLLALIGLSSSYYIINADEVAVVKQLNKKVATIILATDQNVVEQNLEKNNYQNVEVITEKGLHFKIPFIQSVNKFSSKYLTYTSNIERINTKDGRRVEIQMYAQYRIVDPVTFDDTVSTKVKANKIMDDFIYKTVIISANTLRFNEFFYLRTLEDLLRTKQEALNEQLVSEFGLYVSDIGINYKGFPESNIANIEEKMAKEIEKDSEKLIAEGDSEYLQAQAKTDRVKAEIISQAVEEAAVIKAEADATAVKIYQESLKKDLDFYRFIQRMNIYKNIKGSTIFLDRENDIFNYINGYEVATPANN